MRKAAEKIIVASGDLSVFASGQAVFGTDGKPVVLPEQLVVYDPTTNVSLGNTVTKTIARRIVIAQGYDANGNGSSDTLRKGYGDQMWGDFISAAAAEPPRCGAPHIMDVLYDCTDFNQDYTINIGVENDRTQNEYPFGKRAVWSHTVRTDPQDCGDCTAVHLAEALTCKFVDAINGDDASASVLNQSIFQGNDPPQMFYDAVRLSSRSKIYCLNPVDDACTSCISLANLKSIDIDGAVTAFTNNVNPSAATETLIGQLQGIVDQINAAIDADADFWGHAVITQGAGFCCPFHLEINYCESNGDIELLDVNDADIAVCATTNPLAAVPVADDCPACPPAGAGTKTYPTGIRLISRPVNLVLPAGGYPPNPPIGYYSQKLFIEPTKGFERGQVLVRESQAVVEPEGLGYQWKAREYYSDLHGGSGRGQDAFHSSEGPLNLPRGQSAASNTSVNGRDNYCSYIISHSLPFTEGGVTSTFRGAKGRTVVLIPSGDTTTQTDFEAIINNYLGSGTFTLDTLSCASDQDQDAAFASGVHTFAGVGVDTQTITIGATVYTTVTALSTVPTVPFEVLLGADQTATSVNLVLAINGGAGIGTLYSTGTTVNPDVSALSAIAVTTVTAKLAGTDGNLIATTETQTNGSWAAVTLEGGLDSQVIVSPYPNANGIIL